MLCYCLLVFFSLSNLISNNYCFARLHIESPVLQNPAKMETFAEPKHETNLKKCDYCGVQQQNLNFPETKLRKNHFGSETSVSTLGRNFPYNLLIDRYFRPLPYIPIQPYVRKNIGVKSNYISQNEKTVRNEDFTLSDGVQSSETRRKTKVNERKIKKNDDKQDSDYLNLDTYKKSMIFIKGVNCEICTCPIHLSYNPSKCTVCPCK
ncbi:uncharacterized protein LOC142319362 [Lycorma delicatula]|uniref:uncharacterized protein LOC142319362 n=1 Tax=Lycorma delicatula TaxID=130591 RepID=UPI003F5146D9